MKTKILEEMAKEIGSDTFSLGKKTSKGLAYVATAPVIGLLSPKVRERVYGNFEESKSSNYIDWAAQISSAVVETVGASLALGIFARHYNIDDPNFLNFGMALSVLYAGIRGFLSPLIGEKIGSLEGYLPSKGIEYFLDKYDNAKLRIGKMGDDK